MQTLKIVLVFSFIVALSLFVSCNNPMSPEQLRKEWNSDSLKFDIWQYAVVTAAFLNYPYEDPLPKGTYYLKYAVKFNDGRYSKAYNAMTNGVQVLSSNNIFSTDGTEDILQLSYFVSIDSIPEGFQSILVYISTDNLNYKFLHEANLVHEGTITKTVANSFTHNYNWYSGNFIRGTQIK